MSKDYHGLSLTLDLQTHDFDAPFEARRRPGQFMEALSIDRIKIPGGPMRRLYPLSYEEVKTATTFTAGLPSYFWNI